MNCNDCIQKKYGNGSCRTCHVMASDGGPRNSNGTFGSHNFNGTDAPRNRANRTPRNGTFGSRNSNRTLPLNSYGTSFENQPDHATDASAALMAIGAPVAVITVTDTQAAPGFGFAASLAGLFAWALPARRQNK